jgi:cytochrome c553
MKRAITLVATSLAAAVALAQSTDFVRKPPAWQEALTASKDAAAGEAIATKGKGAAVACAGCHGADGVPPPGAPFPRLAGVPIEYVAKQLFDYRDESRPNPIMSPIAKALTDAEIASLAWHYASLQAPGGKTSPTGWSNRAGQLARYGDNALALQACSDCHGNDQTGGGPILPPLTQPAAYIAGQLRAFRANERRNDADSVMRELSKRLSDADIDALAAYYAGR